VLVGSVLAITILLGTPLALLLDQPVIGRSVVRLMVIAPFFVMPTVSALVWKNLLMHPVSGLFAWIATLFGATPIDWFTDAPLFAVILIVAWQWLPFATLILLTALQSQDEEQKEAAEMDGAGAFSKFIYLTLPHLARPITVVILITLVCLLAAGPLMRLIGERIEAMITRVLGVILAAVYLLWMFQRVMFGTLREAYRALPDLSPLEVVCAVPLLVLTVLLGVFPQPAIAIIEPSVQRILAIAAGASQVVLK